MWTRFVPATFPSERLGTGVKQTLSFPLLFSPGHTPARSGERPSSGSESRCSGFVSEGGGATAGGCRDLGPLPRKQARAEEDPGTPAGGRTRSPGLSPAARRGRTARHVLHMVMLQPPGHLWCLLVSAEELQTPALEVAGFSACRREAGRKSLSLKSSQAGQHCCPLSPPAAGPVHRPQISLPSSLRGNPGGCASGRGGHRGPVPAPADRAAVRAASVKWG